MDPCPIPDLESRILFEDSELLVFNKPPNIPSTGKNLDDPDAVQFWLMQRAQGMIWSLHQLDADTSGVNIFIKDKKKVHPYKEQLTSSKTLKKYFAFIHGCPTWNHLHEKSSIGYIQHNHLGVTENGKSAHSEFRVLESQKEISLVEVTLYTGRTHQIRIHLSHLGHPLIGEEWYIHKPCKKHPRQALHAHCLHFDDGPNFEAPLAEDLQALSLESGFKFF